MLNYLTRKPWRIKRPINLWHVNLSLSVCVCVCLWIKHLNGNEHRRWWTNYMVAFIIASYRGDIKPWQEMWWAINLLCIYMGMHAHMLLITVIYSAVGHIWRRPHISVRLRKTWSSWLNQCRTVFHLFQRRLSILFCWSSSVKQMLKKWNHLNSSPKHYKSIIEKKNSPPDIWKT